MSFSGLLSELNDLILTINVAIAIGSILLIWISFKLYLRISRHFKRKSYPPDIVILHQFPRAKRVPSLSPFALKLETWLRMNDIKYQNEFGYSYGPKGKIPYITYNGQDIADSQFCIEFLSKTFKKNLNEDHASKDLGAARAFLKMMEESFLWVSALSRFCYEPNPECTGLPSIVLWYMSHKLKKASNVQGYGRHSKDELFSIGKDDLKSLNDFLAGKKYLIGDKPCNEDASVFGQVVQIIYTNNGILNKFIKDECPNILNYTENIKKTFWPDWAECIKDKKERLIN